MNEDGRDVAGRPPRVLVVESDEEACGRLVSMVEDCGAQALAATRAAQALELFAREKPDLVLAAADLPDLSGADLLRRVTDRSASVRVALMAAWRSRSHFEGLMRAGVVAFLRKPVREHEVVRMLGQLRAEVDFLE